MVLVVCDWCGKWATVARSTREGMAGWPGDFRRYSLRGHPSDSDPLATRISYDCCSSECADTLEARIPARRIQQFETEATGEGAEALRDRLDALRK